MFHFLKHTDAAHVLVIARGFHGTDVVQAVATRIREVHKLDHCTIQPEPSRAELVTLRRKPNASTSLPSQTRFGSAEQPSAREREPA